MKMAAFLNRVTCAICIIGFGLLTGVSGQAADSRRVALVIGVGHYEHLPQLDNTVGDARLIADKLRATGFDVDLQIDPGKDHLSRALRDFGRRIEAGGPDAIAALYYAGHGIQDSKQSNYLVGADADLHSQIDMPLEAMSLDAALQTIEAARPALTFVILDACRDNPFPSSDSRGGSRGLGVQEGRRGLLIAFSTEPGKTAVDGPTGGHSPFATALANELDVPGLEVTQMFKLVTKKVLDDTHNRQFPWVTQRLVEDFYFRPDLSPPMIKTPPAPPTVADATVLGGSGSDDARAQAGEIAYGQAVIQDTAEGYEGWLRQFPNHQRKTSVLALLQRLREDQLWRRAQAATSPQEAISALEVELLAFPSGLYAEKARAKLASLQAAERLTAPAVPIHNTEPPPQPSAPPIDVRRVVDFDAPGNDRGGFIRGIESVADCERICIDDSGCAGYTYNVHRRVCILKNSISPLVRAPEPAITGVIDSRSRHDVITSPVVVQSFRYYEGMDAPRNDLGNYVRNVSLLECEMLCRSSSACVGYTYNRNRSVCIQKKSIDHLEPSREPAVTAVLNGTD